MKQFLRNWISSNGEGFISTEHFLAMLLFFPVDSVSGLTCSDSMMRIKSECES